MMQVTRESYNNVVMEFGRIRRFFDLPNASHIVWMCDNGLTVVQADYIPTGPNMPCLQYYWVNETLFGEDENVS